MTTSPFRVPLPNWFRRDRILAYLGRDPRSVSEKVDGHRVRVGTHLGALPVAVHLEVHDSEAVYDTTPELENPALRREIHRRVEKLLGLVIDPQAFEDRADSDPMIRRLIGDRQGLTIPQTATVFDGLVWVICGQQVSLPVAFALRRRLSRRCGASLGEDFHAPPLAEDVAALETSELGSLGFSRRKSEYLSELSRAVVRGELDLEALSQAPDAVIEERLLERRGLGPWSVHYLMMRSFGRPDCVPVGDAALKRNLQRFYGLDSRPGADETLRKMAPFAPHRSLATFHFWAFEGTPASNQ